MTADQADDSRDDAEAVTRRLEDAIRELRALRAGRRGQQQAARQARHLQQLTVLSQRRRAPQKVMTVADSVEGHDGPAVVAAAEVMEVPESGEGHGAVPG